MGAGATFVLARREGASFVLDPTCDRLALHVPAASSTTCVITCVPYAVTCERRSMTQQECPCVGLYHTCETPCVIIADKCIFTKHTNAVAITHTTSTFYSGFGQSTTGRGSCDLRFLWRHVCAAPYRRVAFELRLVPRHRAHAIMTS